MHGVEAAVDALLAVRVVLVGVGRRRARVRALAVALELVGVELVLRELLVGLVAVRQVALRRRPAVYVVKVAAPTAALSVVGLAAGWLFPLDDFSGRSRLLFAVFFAQAAVARAPAPRVDGLTLLDRFLAVASAACLLAVLEAAAAKLAADFLGGDDGLLVLDAAFHALLAVAYVAANRTFLRALLCY